MLKKAVILGLILLILLLLSDKVHIYSSDCNLRHQINRLQNTFTLCFQISHVWILFTEFSQPPQFLEVYIFGLVLVAVLLLLCVVGVMNLLFFEQTILVYL